MVLPLLPILTVGLTGAIAGSRLLKINPKTNGTATVTRPTTDVADIVPKEALYLGGAIAAYWLYKNRAKIF